MLLQCQAVQISHLFPKWTDLWFLALLEPFVVKTRAISSNTLAESSCHGDSWLIYHPLSHQSEGMCPLSSGKETHISEPFFCTICFAGLHRPSELLIRNNHDNGCVKITGSPPGVILSPWRTFGNVWRNLWLSQLQGWEGVFYWHLVSRGQRCC